MTLDELDTCRICSAPAEPDAPLFHPCKCSGTIRYIHQDCLTTWLAHSKKKTCDVCKHQYSFEKVYSPTMPMHIPFALFLRKLAQQLFFTLILGLRFILVFITWFIFLPYVTVWTWRFYFIVGDNIAWWINDKPRPARTQVLYTLRDDNTDAIFRNQISNSSKFMGFLDYATGYPVWRTLSSDIFTGQIIAIAIILIFLGIFMLREWIIQNVQPGIFDEGDFPDQMMDEEAIGINDPQQQEVIEVPLPNGDNDHLPPFLDGLHDVEVPLPVNNSNNELRRPHEIIGAADGDIEGHARLRRRRRLNSFPDAANSTIEKKVLNRKTTSRRGRNYKGREIRKVASESDINKEYERSSLAIEADGFEFTFSLESEDLGTTSRNMMTSTSEQNAGIPPSYDEESIASMNYDGLRRPLLPSINLSSTGSREDDQQTFLFLTPSDAESPTTHKAHEARAPPSLSSYQSPEQLESGPSTTIHSTYLGNNDDIGGNDVSLDLIDDKTEDGQEDVASDVCDVGSMTMDVDELDVMEEDSEASDMEDLDLDEIDNLDRVDEENLARIDPAGEEDVELDVLIGDIGGDLDVVNGGEGALEAIGMRGPISAIFQHVALMIFLLDTSIGIAIWFPFTLGKTVALCSLQPIRIIQIIQWPIYLMRFITDPMVDFVSSILGRLFASLLSKIASEGPDVAESQTEHTKLLFQAGFFKVFVTENEHYAAASYIPDFVKLLESSWTGIVVQYFARFGRTVRLSAMQIKEAWAELAGGSASTDRFFAALLGYLVVGITIVFYMNVLSIGKMQTAGRAFRNAIKQQLIVIKVAVFIMIELVLFPMGCSMLLDFFTLRIFPEVTVTSRMALLKHAPVHILFFHWMVGTLFMYQFVLLLSGCRKILRPGALWLIKDPRDQNFHPLREILERPTLVLLKKLSTSAVLYSIVLALAIIGLASSLRLWGSLLLPLRWKLNEPISDIPIDLLLLHIIVPGTVRSFPFRHIAISLASRYWRWSAKQLRLTSYMFGDQPLDEVESDPGFIYRFPSMIMGKWFNITPVKGVEIFEGSYRRVPATNDVALPSDMKATAAVTKDGEPVDEISRRLIELQNAEAVRAGRNIEKDYTVVYLPPHFRERVMLFIVALWLVASSVLIASLAAPTLLGRSVLFSILKREVHDVYSFAAGFYVTWISYQAWKALSRSDVRRQRIYSADPRGDWWVYVFKRSMQWTGNFIWVTSWLGFIIPILLALTAELYLIHPIRILLGGKPTLNIRIFDLWALGHVYIKLLVSHSNNGRPNTSIDTAIRSMKLAGWKRVDAVAVTLDIIAPLVSRLVFLICGPIFFIYALHFAVPTYIKTSILLPYVYPCLLAFKIIKQLRGSLRQVWSTWAQQIRDSEFLVELQLQNFNSEPPGDISISTVSSDESIIFADVPL